jgi:hypothetical protein
MDSEDANLLLSLSRATGIDLSERPPPRLGFVEAGHSTFRQPWLAGQAGSRSAPPERERTVLVPELSNVGTTTPKKQQTLQPPPLKRKLSQAGEMQSHLSPSPDDDGIFAADDSTLGFKSCTLELLDIFIARRGIPPPAEILRNHTCHDPSTFYDRNFEMFPHEQSTLKQRTRPPSEEKTSYNRKLPFPMDTSFREDTDLHVSWRARSKKPPSYYWSLLLNKGSRFSPCAGNTNVAAHSLNTTTDSCCNSFLPTPASYANCRYVFVQGSFVVMLPNGTIRGIALDECKNWEKLDNPPLYFLIAMRHGADRIILHRHLQRQHCCARSPDIPTQVALSVQSIHVQLSRRGLVSNNDPSTTSFALCGAATKPCLYHPVPPLVLRSLKLPSPIEVDPASLMLAEGIPGCYSYGFFGDVFFPEYPLQLLSSSRLEDLLNRGYSPNVHMARYPIAVFVKESSRTVVIPYDATAEVVPPLILYQAKLKSNANPFLDVVPLAKLPPQRTPEAGKEVDKESYVYSFSRTGTPWPGVHKTSLKLGDWLEDAKRKKVDGYLDPLTQLVPAADPPRLQSLLQAIGDVKLFEASVKSRNQTALSLMEALIAAQLGK